MKDKNTITTEGTEALTPAELMKKHNSDPKHWITENEIKNLKVGADAEGIMELIRKTKEKEDEDNCHHHENNTYDILDV